MEACTFPHHQVLIPQIMEIGNFMFDNDTMTADISSFASQLQNCTKSKYCHNLIAVISVDLTSYDAAYFTTRWLFTLKLWCQQDDSTLRKESFLFSIMGRRLHFLLTMAGHPESVFDNVRYFYPPTNTIGLPAYIKYGRDLSSRIKDLVEDFPDVRPHHYLSTLERPMGASDRKLVRKITRMALDRDRPSRGYGELWTDVLRRSKDPFNHADVIEAIRRTTEWFVQPLDLPVNQDPFPFATRSRLLRKDVDFRGFARILELRIGDLTGRNSKIWSLLSWRLDEYRKRLKKHIIELEEQNHLVDQAIINWDLDCIFFDLVPPEAVVYEETMLRRMRMMRMMELQDNLRAKVRWRTVGDFLGRDTKPGLQIRL